jgi:hypothetical protein
MTNINQSFVRDFAKLPAQALELLCLFIIKPLAGFIQYEKQWIFYEGPAQQSQSLFSGG